MIDADAKVVRPPGKSPSALRRRHLRFKAHAAEVLLREATRRRPCTVFEQTMVKAGLNAIRPDHVKSFKPKVVGETTEASFERWKRRTERYLTFMAVDHGYSHEEHLAILREAGFRVDREKNISVKISVTLEVTHRVRAYDDDGEAELRAKVTDQQVRRLIYDKYAVSSSRGISWEISRA